MNKVQLSVGQVWKDRKGREVEIVSSDNDANFPFDGSNNESYTPSGTVWMLADSDRCDLIELVQDENGWRPRKATEPAAPSPDADGWIPWVATENSRCPVGREAEVMFRNKDGTRSGGAYCAGALTWDTSVVNPISAYKIVAEEPVSQEPHAQQPAADGWIPYAGGGCPVAGDVTVEVRLRGGQENVAEDAEASDWWDWSIDNVGDDIVAYRVVEETQKAEEPVHAEAHSAQHREAQEAPAIRLLQVAADHMRARAATYDKPDGERSMGKTVAAFNAVTGRNLSEAEGWLLLQLLKDVRLFQRPGYHADSAEDCIAYAALKAEAKMAEGE